MAVEYLQSLWEYCEESNENEAKVRYLLDDHTEIISLEEVEDLAKKGTIFCGSLVEYAQSKFGADVPDYVYPYVNWGSLGDHLQIDYAELNYEGHLFVVDPHAFY